MRTIYSNYAKFLTVLMLAVTSALLTGLAGCGASGDKNAATGAGSITLTAVPVTVKSDGSTSTIITATVLNSGNTVLSGQSVLFTADTGQLLASASAVTDASGEASATFSAGPSGINRTATISATSGAISNQIPIQIVGSTVTVSPASASVLDDGSTTATVTFTALNSAGTGVAGAAITVTETGVGNITFVPASGYTSGATDANGKYVLTVTGVAGGAGTSTLTAAALGATASLDIEVTPVATSFSITGLTLNGTPLTSVATSNFSSTSMLTSGTLIVTATVPSGGNVWFVSSMLDSAWNGLTNQELVPAVGTTATATLTTTFAGMASISVQVDGSPTLSDSLTVAMTAVSPNSITLQATPSVVSKGVSGTSTLIATAERVTVGPGPEFLVTRQPVGGVPIAFSIVNPTGGGETVSPVIAYTATSATASLGLGQASTTFTAGSSSSGAMGVPIRARVLGTAVQTEATGVNATTSGNDATVVIGGTPSSVSFGQATVLGVNDNASQYILAMSVMVSDSNGNPAQGALVNLSLWPIAWSTGGGCLVDSDAATSGTFYNEDANENTALDAGEDGTRLYYASGATASGTGTVDTLITPANSWAGSIPSTVTTDATGTATFNLIYPKSSALWVVDRIRGRTVVQGSDAVGEAQFRLGALENDLNPCRLPPSPFRF